MFKCHYNYVVLESIGDLSDRAADIIKSLGPFPADFTTHLFERLALLPIEGKCCNVDPPIKPTDVDGGCVNSTMLIYSCNISV